MSFETRSSRIGLTSLVVVGLILSLGWATSAFAAPPASHAYSLTGNSRGQLGNGLPLPITFIPPPNGKVPFDVTVSQTAGPDPKQLTLPGTVTQPGLTWGPQTATIGLFLANSNIFQLRTSLIVKAQPGPRIFKAGGRSGPATFTWCPGLPLPTASYNPGCTNPLATGIGITVKGSMRYQKTVAQFGGVNAPIVAGGTKGGASAVIRIPGNAGAPCAATVTVTCIAGFSSIALSGTGVGGNVIGATANGPAPPMRIWPVAVTAAGLVTTVFGTAPINTIPGGAVQSYGAPWTTGKVTVRAPAVGETFYLQGNDGRVNGLGSLSLVAGGVSFRSGVKENANRSWANYQISPFVPAVSNTGLVLLAVLFAGVTTWMIRRATAPTS